MKFHYIQFHNEGLLLMQNQINRESEWVGISGSHP